MNKTEFIEAYRHKFGGLILDAATVGLHGEALSVFVRTILRRVDAELGRIWDEVAVPVGNNGVLERKTT